MAQFSGYIAVDLDGTLAHYNTWEGPLQIGAPIPRMVSRIKHWLEDGRCVKILTARAHPNSIDRSGVSRDEVHNAIRKWCVEHIGTVLEIIYSKDMSMIELWDDRAIGVSPNEGTALSLRLNIPGLKVSQVYDLPNGVRLKVVDTGEPYDGSGAVNRGGYAVYSWEEAENGWVLVDFAPDESTVSSYITHRAHSSI